MSTQTVLTTVSADLDFVFAKPSRIQQLYLKGVKYTDLQSVLNLLTIEEVSVVQDELNSFLTIAEDLRVKGPIQNQSAEHILSCTQDGSDVTACCSSAGVPAHCPGWCHGYAGQVGYACGLVHAKSILDCFHDSMVDKPDVPKSEVAFENSKTATEIAHSSLTSQIHNKINPHFYFLLHLASRHYVILLKQNQPRAICVTSPIFWSHNFSSSRAISSFPDKLDTVALAIQVPLTPGPLVTQL